MHAHAPSSQGYSFLGIEGVPQLGIGLAALGRPGYINLGHDGDLQDKSPESMRKQCALILEEAHKLGIRSDGLSWCINKCI